MDIQDIILIFDLFAGEDVSMEYTKLITLAMYETEAMLRPDADSTDYRLNYLCAAIAFYRYQQVLAARERTAVTYAGKVLTESQNSAFEYAKAMLKDYMQVCSDLLTAQGFVFSSFSDGKEIT